MVRIRLLCILFGVFGVGLQPALAQWSYCSNSVYDDSVACIGSKPSYCSNSVYDDSVACIRVHQGDFFVPLKILKPKK